MTLVTDIHVPLMMNCNDFDEHLTFPVVPTSDQMFNLSKSLFYDKYLQNYGIPKVLISKCKPKSNTG